MPPSTVTSSVWRNPYFVIFLSGQGISVIGTAMASIAFPLLVLEITGSVQQMGVVTAIAGVGSFIASLFSGLLADRVNRRWLLMTSDTLNALLYASIPLVWYLHGPSLPLLYVIAAPLGFLSVTFFIGYSAMVTNLVVREQLTDANSTLQGTAAFAGIIGPILAGIVVARFGAVTAMTANAASFVFSVLSLAIVRTRPIPTDAPVHREREGRLSAMLGGFRFVFANPTLRWMVIIRSGMLVLTGGATQILIFRMEHDLGLDKRLIGIVFGAGAVGVILSSFVTPSLRRRFGFGACFLGGTALIGVATGVYGFAGSALMLIVAELAASFGTSLVVINTMALRQELTPDNLQGRVTAFLQLTIYIFSPISTVIATTLAAHTGAGTVLIGMGIIVLLLVTLGIFTPVRERHPERIAAMAPASTP